MKYELSSIFIMLAFLLGIASFATTTYGGDKKQTNTWSVTVQKPEEDWKEDSKEPIRQIKDNLKIKPIWKTKQQLPVKTAVQVGKMTGEKTSQKSQSTSAENVPMKGKIIYRHWWNDPRVQYAYNISGGDMDFIKTIEAESKWDLNALWDGGKSFWLCQIHKGYNSAMQKAYRALKTDNEKVKMCYDQYKDWVNRGVIKTRLYWFNVRNKPQNKKPFTIQ